MTSCAKSVTQYIVDVAILSNISTPAPPIQWPVFQVVDRVRHPRKVDQHTQIATRTARVYKRHVAPIMGIKATRETFIQAIPTLITRMAHQSVVACAVTFHRKWLARSLFIADDFERFAKEVRTHTDAALMRVYRIQERCRGDAWKILRNDTERAAFIICACLAEHRGPPPDSTVGLFYIAVSELRDRLALMHKPQAARILKRFEKLGILDVVRRGTTWKEAKGSSNAVCTVYRLSV